MQAVGNPSRRHASSHHSGPHQGGGVGSGGGSGTNPVNVGLTTEMSRFVKQAKRLKVLLKVSS